MKKKMLGLLLSTAMLATTVAGCGSTAATTASAPAAEETVKTEAAESTAADTADTETEAGDGSELAYAGELEIMHYSTSEESEGNGGSDGFRIFFLHCSHRIFHQITKNPADIQIRNFHFLWNLY